MAVTVTLTDTGIDVRASGMDALWSLRGAVSIAWAEVVGAPGRRREGGEASVEVAGRWYVVAGTRERRVLSPCAMSRACASDG
jgi:hypothetical protein